MNNDFYPPKTYGISPDNPVHVAGESEVNKYLNRLITKDGQSLSWNRMGTAFAGSKRDPVYIYGGDVNNTGKRYWVYIKADAVTTSSRPPVGLLLTADQPDSNIDKPIRYCKKCGARMLEGGSFCNRCGSKYEEKQTCIKCGREIVPGSLYCHYCGTKIDNTDEPLKDEIKHSKTNRTVPTNKVEKTILGVIGVVVLALFIANQMPGNNSGQTPGETTVSKSVETTPESKASTETEPPKKETRKIPLRMSNGQNVKTCGYRGTCPFKVNAGTGSNYYIMMKYLGPPRTSTENRISKSGVSGVWKSDFSFYVEGGKSTEKDVPIGRYEMYYACGDEFYGHDDLFGEGSRAYKADTVLEFYASRDSYNGHEISLYPVPGGNLETDIIDVSELPVLD